MSPKRIIHSSSAADGLLRRLPPEIVVERVLATRPSEVVFKAQVGGVTAAVRAMVRPDQSALAEWSALVSVSSERVAGFLAWGMLERPPGEASGTGLWIARRWIDGESLELYARRAASEAIALAVADVFEALEDVHAAGLLHGDLSPGNVIVDREGRGFLTDFGMASASEESDPTRRRTRSGTPLFMSPEVLAGAFPTAASDLFSLAAVLALALANVEVDPAQFYGRFPAESFLDSANIQLESLPSWSRWILSTLLSRDLESRRSGEFSWADQLKSEVDGSPARTKRLYVPPLSVLEQRHAFIDELLSSEASMQLVATADDDESTACLGAVALQLLQRGHEVRCVDVAELAKNARSTLDVDRRVAAQLSPLRHLAPEMGQAGGRGVLLVSMTVDDAWALEVLDILAHAAMSSRGWTVLAFVDRLRSARVVRRGTPWAQVSRADLPGLTGESLEKALRAHVASPDTGESWVDVLDRLAQGSVCRLNHHLVRAAGMGAFERLDGAIGPSSHERLRVSNAFRWEELLTTDGLRLPPELGDLERRALAALVLLGGVAAQNRLAQLVPKADLPAALDRLHRLGVVARRERGRVSLLGSTPPLAEFGLSREALVALHRNALEGLVSGRPESWVHLLGASESPTDERVGRVTTEVLLLQRRGLHALVVRGLGRARSLLESEHRSLPPELMAELALALARSGSGAAARATANLAGASTVIDEVDGILAHVAGKVGESVAALERAGRPLQALVEASYGALEGGDKELFEELVTRASGLDQEAERNGVRAWVDLLGLRASAAARRGDPDSAFRLLDQALELAEQSEGPLAAATVRITRAGVARSMGDRALSRRDVDRARELFQEAGYAAGEAQAQALLGALLKDEGQLAEAEQPLLTALGRRERLGARAVAAMTRGTLGILLAERGHLRRALDELDRARHELREHRMLAPAQLVESALDLVLARMGRPPAGGDSERSSTSDPRIRRWHQQAENLRAWDPEESRSAPVDVDGDPPAEVILLRATGEADHSAAHAAELYALAVQRADQGRDAAAARLGIEAAVRAARVLDDETAKKAASLAVARLERVLQGLGVEEARRAELTLLSIPDPHPDSLAAWRNRQDEDMEVAKILDLNERLVRQEDTSTLLGAIVEAALEVSGAERGFIVMSHDGELALDTAFDSSRGDIGDEEVDYSRSIVEEALAGRRTLRVSDAAEHDEWSGARSVEDLHLRSILAAPFFVSPRVAGVVVVDDRTRPGAFGPREERLLGLLGGQAALAMRQVHRLEENRRLAAELRRRVLTQGVQLQEATRALDRAGMVAPIEGLIGESQAMETVRSLIHRVARADIATLITGRSGSGKEVAARALHGLSDRRDAPFVAENCAALPPSLAESELFGVKRGAFTGAEGDRPGLFERAEGGTLFLDEIGELPLELQAKLLRVLETRRVRRVGEAEERAVNFRLVSATNRDLGAESEAGRFRADLMYRLDGVTIRMPALEERTEDIPILVRHFLSLGAASGEAPRSMSTEVLRRLMDRPWPGNVRELANEVSRLSVLSVGAIDDPDLVRSPAGSEGGSGGSTAPTALGDSQTIRPIAELERMAIFDALKATGDDKREAAKLLGISRAKIYQRLKEWGE